MGRIINNVFCLELVTQDMVFCQNKRQFGRIRQKCRNLSKNSENCHKKFLSHVLSNDKKFCNRTVKNIELKQKENKISNTL